MEFNCMYCPVPLTPITTIFEWINHICCESHQKLFRLSHSRDLASGKLPDPKNTLVLQWNRKSGCFDIRTFLREFQKDENRMNILQMKKFHQTDVRVKNYVEMRKENWDAAFKSKSIGKNTEASSIAITSGNADAKSQTLITRIGQETMQAGCSSKDLTEKAKEDKLPVDAVFEKDATQACSSSLGNEDQPVTNENDHNTGKIDVHSPAGRVHSNLILTEQRELWLRAAILAIQYEEKYGKKKE